MDLGFSHPRVAALSGKVVEHHLGYRAQHARARAVVAFTDKAHLMTDDQFVIDALYGEPCTVMGAIGSVGRFYTEDAKTFLKEWKQQEEKWT